MSLNCDGWKWQNPYLKISSHTCGCIGFHHYFLLLLWYFQISSSSLLKLITVFSLFDWLMHLNFFYRESFVCFFFVLFVVLVEIKQCLNFQCWTIKIIKNSGVLFYFLFHEKTIFCDQFSYFDKVCNDEEKFIVFNCFFIRIYLERKKKNLCDYFLVFTCSLIRV